MYWISKHQNKAPTDFGFWQFRKRPLDFKWSLGTNEKEQFFQYCVELTKWSKTEYYPYWKLSCGTLWYIYFVF